MQIAFCVFGIDEGTLERVEFYRQDVMALRSLGHQVEFISSPRRLRGAYDAAVVWWWNYLWLWGPILRLRRIPLLAVGVFDDFPPLSSAKMALKRWGCRFGQLNAVVSQHEYDRLVGTEFDAARLRLAPLTIDAEFFYPAMAAGGGAEMTVVNVAWQKSENMQRKMLPELVEAFAAVAPCFPNCRLILAGRHEDGTVYLQQRVQELRLSDRVEFPGEISREEKRRLMQTATVYCQVSRYEGFGLATAEALACGAPVLTSRVGAVEEVLGPDVTYVAEVSAAGIRDGLMGLLADPVARSERARRGAARLQREYGFERRCRDYDRLLRELLPSYPATPTERAKISPLAGAVSARPRSTSGRSIP